MGQLPVPAVQNLLLRMLFLSFTLTCEQFWPPKSAIIKLVCDQRTNKQASLYLEFQLDGTSRQLLMLALLMVYN